MFRARINGEAKSVRIKIKSQNKEACGIWRSFRLINGDYRKTSNAGEERSCARCLSAESVGTAALTRRWIRPSRASHYFALLSLPSSPSSLGLLFRAASRRFVPDDQDARSCSYSGGACVSENLLPNFYIEYGLLMHS